MTINLEYSEWRPRQQKPPLYEESGGGFSTSPGITRVNWPRCSSSRPLPPRPVTSYFVVLIVCSAPAARLDAHDVAIAGRGNESEHAVLATQFDEDDAFARAGQIVHFVRPAQDGACLFGRGNHNLVTRDFRDADDLDAL